MAPYSPTPKAISPGRRVDHDVVVGRGRGGERLDDRPQLRAGAGGQHPDRRLRPGDRVVREPEPLPGGAVGDAAGDRGARRDRLRCVTCASAKPWASTVTACVVVNTMPSAVRDLACRGHGHARAAARRLGEPDDRRGRGPGRHLGERREQLPAAGGHVQGAQHAGRGGQHRLLDVGGGHDPLRADPAQRKPVGEQLGALRGGAAGRGRRVRHAGDRGQRLAQHRDRPGRDVPVGAAAGEVADDPDLRPPRRDRAVAAQAARLLGLQAEHRLAGRRVEPEVQVVRAGGGQRADAAPQLRRLTGHGGLRGDPSLVKQRRGGQGEPLPWLPGGDADQGVDDDVGLHDRDQHRHLGAQGQRRSARP